MADLPVQPVRRLHTKNVVFALSGITVSATVLVRGEQPVCA